MSRNILLGCCVTALLLTGVALGETHPRTTKSSRACQQAKQEPQTTAAERAIEHKLASARISLNFRDVPLKQAIAEIRVLSGITVVLDTPALEEAGVNFNFPVTGRYEDQSGRTILKLLLKQARLTYVIRDEVCLITPEKVAIGKPVRVTYPVGLRSADEPSEPNVAGSLIWKTTLGVGLMPLQEKPLEEQLSQMICQIVAPKTWASEGGCGTIEYCPLDRTLVVHQTGDVQEEISDLLAALRKLHDLQVVLDVQMLQVSDAFLERLPDDMRLEPNGPTSAKPIILEEGQVARLLELAQQARHTQVLRAPRVTVANGQPARLQNLQKQTIVTSLEVTEENEQTVVRPKTEEVTTGLTVSFQPVVTADRTGVRVAVEWQRTSLATRTPLAPVNLHLTRTTEDGEEQTIPVPQLVQRPKVSTQDARHQPTIPVGKSALLHGGQIQGEARSKCGTAPRGRQSCLSRRGRHVGYGRETQQCLILVTPRIITREEEK